MKYNITYNMKYNFNIKRSIKPPNLKVKQKQTEEATGGFL